MAHKRFWQSNCGSLKEQFPSMYDIVKYPYVIEVRVMNQVSLNMSFKDL
jgi:hypothetical protein